MELIKNEITTQSNKQTNGQTAAETQLALYMQQQLKMQTAVSEHGIQDPTLLSYLPLWMCAFRQRLNETNDYSGNDYGGNGVVP